jgi:hypothetical protein
MLTITTKGIHATGSDYQTSTDNRIDAILWLSLRTSMHDTVFFIVFDTRFT